MPVRASKRASERRLGGSSQEPPEPECHKHDPSDRTCFLLYKLRAWVHFAGRHIQPAQPSRTRRTTGWQACTTGTTGLIPNKKKKNWFFLLEIHPVVLVVHACQPVVRLVVDGCDGCTCLPAKCTQALNWYNKRMVRSLGSYLWHSGSGRSRLDSTSRRSLARSLAHTLTHSLTDWLTDSLTHSLTRSIPHSLTQAKTAW